MSDAVRATGIGSWPGKDLAAALRISFVECPELPFLPELPERGPWAAIIGRGTALLPSLGIDLQQPGWRLTHVSSRDHRRAMDTLRTDIDQLEEAAQGYAGPLKVAVAGPWTLAASLEHPRGDKVLADRGARRDVVQSLAEGIGSLVEDLRRRLPELEVIVQLDEPGLPTVLAGGVRTASGLSRHRAVDIPEVSAAYTSVVERVAGPVWVHSCAPGVPVALLHRARIGGVLLDLDLMTSATWDEIGPALEEGLVLGLGAQPTDRVLDGDEVARRAIAPLRRLELDPALTRRTVLHASCGLAGLSVADAVRSLRAVRTAATIVTEQLSD